MFDSGIFGNYSTGGIMKFTKILFTLAVFVSTFALANNPKDEADVRQALSNYYSAIDDRNSSVVEQALYQDATVLTINTITNKTSKFSAADLIDKVKKGGLGGWKRDVKVDNVDFNDKAAIAKVEIADAKVKQISFVTLVNDEGKWKIVSDVSTLSSNK
jgi:hypothetical protein